MPGIGTWGWRRPASLDLLVVVDGVPGGTRAGHRRWRARRRAAAGARSSRWPTPDAAVAGLLDRLRPGDVVLVKASRGVELERVVDGLVQALGARGAGA